jgi:hypothetical protein
MWMPHGWAGFVFILTWLCVRCATIGTRVYACMGCVKLVNSPESICRLELVR